MSWLITMKIGLQAPGELNMSRESSTYAGDGIKTILKVSLQTVPVVRTVSSRGKMFWTQTEMLWRCSGSSGVRSQGWAEAMTLNAAAPCGTWQGPGTVGTKQDRSERTDRRSGNLIPHEGQAEMKHGPTAEKTYLFFVCFFFFRLKVKLF